MHNYLSQSTTGRFTINVTPCLIGYQLADSDIGGLTCQCNNNADLVGHCEDDQRTILLTVRISTNDSYNNCDYVCMYVGWPMGTSSTT